MKRLGKNLSQIFSETNKVITDLSFGKMIIQILERIEIVHDYGFIHGDIKPENIVIGDEDQGLIYLIDFGVSSKY